MVISISLLLSTSQLCLCRWAWVSVSLWFLLECCVSYITLCVCECSHSRMCELEKIKESVNVKSICIFVIQKPNLCPVIMYWCVKLDDKCEENCIFIKKNVGRLVYKTIWIILFKFKILNPWIEFLNNLNTHILGSIV